MSDGIFTRRLPYLDRSVQIGIASGRVISLSFPEDPDPDAAADHELLDRVEAYCQGVKDDFRDVTVAFTLGGVDRAILETTREIGYGEEITVETLARMSPELDPEETDRVRSVLAKNPAPLFVPDHRVRNGASAAPPAVVTKLRHVEGL